MQHPPRLFHVVCILGWLLLVTIGVGYAAPNLVNYQGVLTNNAGEPITGTLPMKFELFTHATDGAPGSGLWSESHTAIDVVGGVYSVVLGSVTDPLSADIFAGDDLWLQVTVDGEILSPRQQLTSVAYAQNSAMLGGVAASEFLNASSADPVTISGQLTLTSGSPHAGRILTAIDETGLASWQTNSLNNLSDAINDGASIYLGGGAGINDNGDWRSNTGVGTDALTSNISGYSNTAVGINAMASNQTGHDNAAVGADALGVNTVGVENVGVGAGANYYNQEGDQNTIVGTKAGYGETFHSKSGNIFIGFKAGYFETGSNKLYIENSDSTTPLIGGDFSTNSIDLNGTVHINGRIADNVGIGTAVNSSRRLNVLGGTSDRYSGYFVASDSNGSAMGIYSEASGSTDHGSEDVHYGIYGYATNASRNYGLVGNAIDSSATTNYGVYGYATGASANYAGYFDGNIGYTGALLNLSDRRLKNIIAPVENPLEKLDAITGLYYTLIDDPDEVRIGVIAQDVQAVLPEAVAIIDPENGYLGVNYTSLVPVLIEAVKELKSEKEILNTQVGTLRAQIDTLQSLVCQDHPDAGICQ